MAKCVGLCQCGAGRPDGANTMVKTIQYLAEADPTQVPVFDLTSAFQSLSRRSMPHSIELTDLDFAAVFSRWYTSATEHRTHFESTNTKINADNVVDPGCPLSTCGISAASLRTLTRSFGSSCLTSADCLMVVPNSLPIFWIKHFFLDDALVLISAAVGSVNLALQASKIEVWKGT